MPDNNLHRPEFDWRLITFEGARREQLRRWAQLSLEDILRALEEMEDLSRQLGPAPADESGEPAPGLIVKESSGVYGTSGSDDLALAGCTPEPLMAYLKALGVLRLVSEQKDPEARGWWRNDVFWLRAPELFKDAATEEAKRDALAKFFLEEYKPTPIVAPWAGGSGFFRKDNKRAVAALGTSNDPRIARYTEVIRQVQAIIQEEGIGDKPKNDDKTRLICRYRRDLPDNVVAWMDAVMVLQQVGQSFAPLLGTGGNDGRLDFTQNFMQRIVSLGLHTRGVQSGQSKRWLHQALFASLAKLDSASVGQFAPGRVGGPNATQGMEGDSTDNPWDFVLMMEGTLVLAGAAVRRLGASRQARSSFPFTVRAVAAGFEASTRQDEFESRGELWCPLWTRPASTDELRQLFGEGRAEVSGRPAQNGTDFARAVAGLGVDRGIAGFSRFGFLKRSGKAFLAAPIGRFAVTERRKVDLLREADGWLSRFRRAVGDQNAPPHLGSALRRIDAAVFDFCKYGAPTFFQAILIALGRAERLLSMAERFREEKQISPLSGLSAGWIVAANDHSLEFTAALALVSINDSENKIGPFRANLEPVDWKKRCRAWADKGRAVVWNPRDLTTNLTDVLQRRMIDGQRAGCEHLPLASRFTVSLETVAAFLDGDLDEQRVADLLWGLMLIDQRGLQSQNRPETADWPIPRAYALLKLLFLPRPVIADRQNGQVLWRLARKGEAGIAIRPEPRILPLLCAGRIGEACRIAAQRLRVSGLPPCPGVLPNGMTRDDTWAELVSDRRHAQRLSASLLIPINSASVNRLVHLVCRDELAFATT
jgi:CRISPR-associated protein Csx17